MPRPRQFLSKWCSLPLVHHAIVLCLLQLLIQAGTSVGHGSRNSGCKNSVVVFATAEATPVSTSSHLSASNSVNNIPKNTAFLKNVETQSDQRTTRKKRQIHQLLQVQIIHRHGDRTPITPMKNETYWKNQIPSSQMLRQIAKGTRLVKNEDEKNRHAANGRGPFGQLTVLGVLEMVELGSRLRDELHLFEDDNEEHESDDNGTLHLHRGRLFTPRHPLHPRRIKVTSTNFPRTIQSVQGLLIGLFPDSDDNNDEPEQNDAVVDIDTRHTSIMIPDPQPRRTKQQEILEKKLASRPHIIEKEYQMRDFALRMTDALSDQLGTGADDVSFGVGEEGDDDDGDVPHKDNKRKQPLPWSQLSEITKCLQVRDLLPNSITKDDVQRIASHSAWKWFEHLRHPPLAKLAMNDLVCRIVNVLHDGKNCPRVGCIEQDAPWLHIYSAHDSTLVGLLCAFQLESPAQWPGYASYLKVELIKVETVTDEEEKELEKDETEATNSNSNSVRHYVRFSLNGEILPSRLFLLEEKEEGDDDGLPSHMIPLEHLTAMVQDEAQ